jgi:hypothetical protein
MSRLVAAMIDAVAIVLIAALALWGVSRALFGCVGL